MSRNDRSEGMVHVHSHSRGGGHGMVDVSAYYRSPPGDGSASQARDRVWERHDNAEFRNAIASSPSRSFS